MSADEGYISFTGGSTEEAEDFIVAIKRRAFSKGKHMDNAWIAQFASACLERKALRWYENLDRETQNDWDLLKRAILEEYKEAPLPPSIVPTSAPALKSSDRGPTPGAGWPFRIRIGRIRVDSDFRELQGYISNSFDDVHWCIVTPNQSTAATFEFDVLARTMKFQGTADEYLAARLWKNNWESNNAKDGYAAAVRNSGQTMRIS
ncbi:hypothetical protein M407DRAFT_198308 [Tulasnella calospora MUT 4182]|uniref:Retrotransposon gag domain-containing protein n=1 Tax=Tulasnella calospora MUT 4182 TaxID=1051891 RepID=A0A0C3LGX3_9AGAM|nr:hypothetical protein M407DRAFT_198308 [Tulasnella calospora MUT 4182]